MDQIREINVSIFCEDSEYGVSRPIFINVRKSDGNDNIERLNKAIVALQKLSNDYQLKMDIPL